jgi:threonine synthase
MSIWDWRDLLPAVPEEHQISLGEGNSPLIVSRRLGPESGLHRLSLKLEISNPSGSYKDRFAASAISHMRAAGQSLCIATSSGNTGAALAAYCAAASVACQIAVVETAPDAKLLQMMAYGAKIYRVERFGIDPVVTEQVFDALLALADRPDAALQISAFKYSPLGMAGVQTISYEIGRQNDRVQHVFVPAGGGGLTLAVARGFQQLAATAKLDHCPKIHCVQPAGNNTIAGPLRAGAHAAIDVTCTTAISGLQVPSVIDGNEVVELCRATGGTGYTVADDDIYAVQCRLAQQEGIFCEPAGAVAVTAALAAVSSGEIDGRDEIVCLVTGSGFKDLASAERISSGNICRTVCCERLGDCMVA